MANATPGFAVCIGVNFINPLAQSVNTSVLVVWLYRFCQQKYAQLYQNTQLEVLSQTFMLDALCCGPVISA